MKTLTTVLVVFAAIVAIHAQSNQSPTPSIAGRWVLTTSAEGPHGATSMPLVLAQDGSRITATLTPPHGGEIALTGEFTKGELKLATAADGDKHHAVTLQAKLKDDGSLAGYSSGPMGDVMWTAVRAKGVQ